MAKGRARQVQLAGFLDTLGAPGSSRSCRADIPTLGAFEQIRVAGALLRPASGWG